MASNSVSRRCHGFWIRTRHCYAGARKNTLPSSALHQPIFDPTSHSVICPSLMIHPLWPKHTCTDTKSESGSSDQTVSLEKKSMKRVNPYSLYRAIRSDPEGHLLGIDVHPKVIKLAITGPPENRHFVSFLRELYPLSMDEMAEELKKVVSDHSIVGFIFGCDDNLDGRDIENMMNPFPESVQVKQFVEELSKTRKLGEMKYACWNNNFANECLKVLIQRKGLKMKKRKSILVQGPPSLMLRHFLNVSLDKMGGSLDKVAVCKKN